jgi:hypothetical protein
MSFLRQWMSGQKKLLKNEDVTPLAMPRLKEFTLKTLYDQVKGDRELMMHLPDPEMSRRPTDRKFAYTIVNSLRPDYLRKIFDDAMSERVILSANVPVRDEDV